MKTKTAFGKDKFILIILACLELVFFFSCNLNLIDSIEQDVKEATRKSLTLVSPNGGNTYLPTETLTIEWQGTLEGFVRIELIDGENVSVIVDETKNDGKYEWTISDSLEETKYYKIRIVLLSDTSVADISDSAFTVSSFILVSPNGQERFWKTMPIKIEWQSVYSGYITIEYLEGTTLHTIAENIPIDSGSYSWDDFTGIGNGDNYQVRISCQNVPGVVVTSASNFTINDNSPTDLTASDGTHNMVVLNWLDTVSTGVEGYKIYRSTSPSSGYTVAGTTDLLTFSDDGALAGVTYYYRIKAYDELHESNPSAFDDGFANDGGIYVKTDGDDENIGSQYFPKQTIQAAIDFAGAGTEVRVAEGTYNLTEPIYMKAGVSLRGGYSSSDWNICDPENHPTSIIDLQSSGQLTKTIICEDPDMTRDTSICGFTIQASANDSDSYAIAVEYCGATLQDNIILGGSSWGYGIGIFVFSGDPLIIDNSIDASTIGTASWGIYIDQNDQNDACAEIIGNTIAGGNGTSYSRGIEVIDGNANIINNVIDAGSNSNETSGIELYGINQYSVKIFNNTINGGTATEISSGILLGNFWEQNVEICNNIIYTSGGSERYGIYENYSDSDPTDFRNNCIYDCPTALYCDAVDYSTSTNLTDINDLNDYTKTSQNETWASEGNVGYNSDLDEEMKLSSTSPFEVGRGGLDLSAEGFSDDRDMIARTVPWSMGAFEEDSLGIQIGPSELEASDDIRPDKITLRWVSDATSFKVYRSTASDSGFTEIGTSSSTEYEDNTAPDIWTTYYYKTTALHNSIESIPSAVDEGYMHDGTLYVSANGDDAHMGSVGAPKLSVPLTVELSGSPTTVKVATGTYSISSQISIKEGVSLLGGYSADFSQRDPAFYPTSISDSRAGTHTKAVYFGNDVSDSSVLDGFILYGAASNISQGDSYIVYIEGGNPIISNNILYGGDIPNTAAGDTYCIYTNNSSAVIDSNILYGGANYEKSYGISTRSSSSEITNNIIIMGLVTRVWSYAHSTGIYIWSGGSSLISNNLINAKHDATRLYCIYGTDGATIQNNILLREGSGTSFGIYEISNDPVAVDNNCIVNFSYYYMDNVSYEADHIRDGITVEGSSGSLESMGNIDPGNPTDIYFQDFLNEDYHLTLSTPVSITEGGLDLSAFYTIDFDDVSRTSPWSMGPYEY